MTDRQRIIEAALSHARFLLGSNYTQNSPGRFYFFPGGSCDCSSFQASNYSAAGFPLLDAKGAELLTSCYEVNAKGFDLLYPSAPAMIGRSLPSDANLLTNLGAQPGDLVFYNTIKDTPRTNKITHIAMVLDASHIIHNGNNRDKCCIRPITNDSTKICAVIRPSDNIILSVPGSVSQGSTDRVHVRMLQVLLNWKSKTSPKLVCDADFGSLTLRALKQYQTENGIQADGVCAQQTWERLLSIAKTQAPFDITDYLLNTRPYIKGDQVRAIQQRLTELGYDVGTIDGVFGAQTALGVQAFQSANSGKLITNGVIDKLTCEALGGTWHK